MVDGAMDFSQTSVIPPPTISCFCNVSFTLVAPVSWHA